LQTSLKGHYERDVFEKFRTFWTKGLRLLQKINRKSANNVELDGQRAKGMKAMNAKMESVMTQNDKLQKALDATTKYIQQIAEEPPPTIATPTANQAVPHKDFQTWATSFASDISSQISALAPLSNPNAPPNNRLGGGSIDRTGYWYNDLCGNCGVQLGVTPGQGTPGRCRDKCITTWSYHLGTNRAP